MFASAHFRQESVKRAHLPAHVAIPCINMYEKFVDLNSNILRLYHNEIQNEIFLDH